MKLSRVVLVGALIGSSFVASAAHAETKSWAALKGKVPASTVIVGSVDATAIRATPSFPKVMEFVRGQGKEIGEVLDLVKTACGTELTAMLGDVAFAFDERERGVIVISLAGMDQKKVTECGTKVLAAVQPKAKLATKVTGKLTEYSIGNDKLYAAWLAPDMLAVSTEDKDSNVALEAMLAGAAPAGDLAAYVGKANTAAAAWIAGVFKEDDMKGGWATLTIGKTVAVALRATATTPKAVEKARKEANDAKKRGLEKSAKLPELKKVFQAMKVGGTGNEVTVDVSVPESSIPALLPAFDKVL